MSVAVSSSRLRRAYAMALGLHALIVTGLAGLALYGAVMPASVANSARGGALLTLLLALVTLVPAVPSIFALLSCRLCRRNGWEPSPGHMWITIAAAALVILLFVGAYLT